MTEYPLLYSFNKFQKWKIILTNKRSYIMSRVSELQSLVDDTKMEMEKFYEKGNKAAGTRARKGLQDLKKLAQDIRLEIQSKKNAE